MLDLLVVSCLARVEVPAAIWRKRRLGELSEKDARLLTGEFEADYCGGGTDSPRFVVVALTAEILDLAAVLAGGNGLRAYDAVQLATAVAVREADLPAQRSRVTTGSVRRRRRAWVPASDLSGDGSSRWSLRLCHIQAVKGSQVRKASS
ncbi:MAG: type II toxin-antitoxin system VapC family toxin [Egibacteraceae bacterium]